MKSLIGHNQPPKDRKADWKSISVHKDVYKKLEQVAENMLNLKNCFLLLDGEAPIKKVSIPYAIEVLFDREIDGINRYLIQDNGRDIWEQTAKKLLRTYNSKKGLGIKNAK
jgi:hypothetical protein|tara:strand:+ start:2775 stop:3107 length:333 start_codon:yes stop_codon:yes gene_type:complete